MHECLIVVRSLVIGIMSFSKPEVAGCVASRHASNRSNKRRQSAPFDVSVFQIGIAADFNMASTGALGVNTPLPFGRNQPFSFVVGGNN